MRIGGVSLSKKLRVAVSGLFDMSDNSDMMDDVIQLMNAIDVIEVISLKEYLKSIYGKGYLAYLKGR